VKQKNKKSNHVIFALILIALFGIGLGVIYFAMRLTIVEKFGKPVQNLGFVQQMVYPLDLFFNRDKLTEPGNISLEEQVFIVDHGESVSMVCLRLEKAGFIDDAELLRTYLVYTGLDRMLKSGQFKLDGGMSPVEIADAMLDVTPTEAIVTILPGWRIEELAANIAGSGLSISAEDFINAAYHPTADQLALLPISDAASLEGFLFPGTYIFPRETDLAFVIDEILMTFTANVDQDSLDGFARQGLTVGEAVTLASIIEKEAVVDDEKPMIASVFFNRLSQGMRLETDPTIQYALGFQETTATWWKSPLAIADLSVQSPYNTYLVAGLPPTPICNPGLESLRSVAYPAETPYFFFRSACDESGRHNFAITFEEHVNNQCE